MLGLGFRGLELQLEVRVRVIYKCLYERIQKIDSH